MCKKIVSYVFVAIVGMVLSGALHSQEIFSLNRNSDWEWEEEFDRGRRATFDLRYNRVEGIYTGLRVKRYESYYGFSNKPFIYGFTGYSFGSNDFEYLLGLEKGFFEDYHIAFGGEYHRMIDTEDRWIIPDLENSLAAFFLKEDFQDFYFREGGSFYISQNFTKRFNLTAAYRYEELDSLAKSVNWALFAGKSKDFRENPAMDAGTVRSITANFTIDSRNSRSAPYRGWYIQFEYEHAGGDLGGDFSFDRVLMDIRRYQPIGFNEGLDFRLRIGTANGYLPWHKSFHLGGLSTLRGFKYKEFPNGPLNRGGNRMLLAQIEYRMGEQDLPDELDWGLLELFNLIIFIDSGWVGDTDSGYGLLKGFGALSWKNLKTDVGIALANRSGSVRFEVARRTDTGKKPFRFLFRITRPF